ncbi:uncharacterized protein [Typha angustifolia]|uniref:uncharacterized protein n=1 Tax=Typha angustifolia TaxID=59011 RepID=UPI003C305789
MSSSEVGDGVEEHGTALDEGKKRVKCNYCGKEVRGFNRLKHHLGGVGSDVVACAEAPDDVKACMRDALLEKKKERLLKEVGRLYHPELPLKRNFSPVPLEPRRCQPKTTQSSTEKGKNSAETAPAGFSRSGFHLDASQRTSTDGGNVVQPPSVQAGNGSIGASNVMEDTKPIIKEEVKDDSVLLAARSIGRFFFEAGIGPSGTKLPSFQRMIDAVIGCGAGFRVPTCDEIKGWILQQEMKEIVGHVEDVKKCWGQTGCSILLDSWTNQRGRSLISFLVQCPQTTIFLRSMDVSDSVRDVDALFLLLCKVVEEIDVHNVVQVIVHDASRYMQAAGQKLVEKYRSIFWTSCADYCINLILEKIAIMDHVKKVLDEAKTITRYIYSHALTLELMKKHIPGRDLVKISNLKSVAQFSTLGNLLSERENIINMFSSPAWSASVWASREKGKATVELVRSLTFWNSAADVIKVTDPLVGILHLIYRSDKAPLGILYDAMDRAKETIRKNLGGEESRYSPFWDIIDDIWDNYLHSSIHSAGYYLNPSLFYSNEFYVDAEVTNGLLDCIVRMAKNQDDQNLIVKQLEAYRTPSGGFAECMAVDQRTKISPVMWWSLHGGQSPELQRLAIRILSQTCSGAMRYKLARGLSDRLHAEKRNFIEQQAFSDMEYVHYNRTLWCSATNMDETSNSWHENLNQLGDWFVEC